MQLDEVEIGQEVICTKIIQTPPFGNTSFRGIGHIGKILSVFPLQSIVFIGHIELSSDGYAELITAYFTDEVELYSTSERKLQEAIQKTLTQITRN